MLNTQLLRTYFPAIDSGRIITNNAASTQIPTQLLKLLDEIAPYYDNVHRGQSETSQRMTEKLESSYDTIAQFIGAPSRKNIILYRNATEAINSVMYSLLTEFRNGDNLVTTFMEHNSNYVPTLAHKYLKLDPAASCRLSFYIYNNLNDVETACNAVRECIR